MTIFFDGIQLPNDLRLDPPLESMQKVEIETMPTRGGNDLVWMKLKKDIPFDVVGGSNWGAVPFQTIQALAAKAAVVDYSLTLNFNGAVYVTYFRHSEEKVIEYTNPYGGVPTATQIMTDFKLKLVWKVT